MMKMKAIKTHLNLIIIISVVLLWALLYIVPIYFHGLTSPEIGTVKICKLTYFQMIKNRAHAGHCPLYFSLSWLVFRLAGTGEVAVRFLPLLFGTACIPLMFLIMRRVSGDTTALFSSLFLLVTPYQIAISQFARPYSFLLLLALLSTYVIIRTEQTQVPGRGAALFGIITLLGLLTSHAYWFVLSPQLVYLLANRTPKWRLALASFLGVIFFLPWIYFSKSLRGRSEFLEWIDPFQMNDILILPAKLLFSGNLRDYGVSYNVALVASIVICSLAIIAFFQLKGSSRRLLFFIWIGPILLAALAGALGWGNLTKYERYFSVSAAVQSALIAAAIVGSVNRMVRTRISLGILAACILLTLSLSSFFDRKTYDIPRRIAQRINAQLTSDEEIFLFGHKGVTEPVEWYLSKKAHARNVTAIPGQKRSKFTSHVELLEHIKPNTSGAWVLYPKWLKRDPDISKDDSEFSFGHFADHLNASFKNSTVEEYGHYILIHFR